MLVNQAHVFRRGPFLEEGMYAGQMLQMVSSAAGQNKDCLLVIYLVHNSLLSENESQDCPDHSTSFYSYPNLRLLGWSKLQGGKLKKKKKMRLQLSLQQLQGSIA